MIGLFLLLEGLPLLVEQMQLMPALLQTGFGLPGSLQAVEELEGFEPRAFG